MSSLIKVGMLTYIIFFCLSLCYAEVIASNEVNYTDPNTYIVSSISTHEFVVNNKNYDPKTFCDVVAGDRVKFFEDNPDDCVDAKFLILRTQLICNVWCE